MEDSGRFFAVDLFWIEFFFVFYLIFDRGQGVGRVRKVR